MDFIPETTTGVNFIQIDPTILDACQRSPFDLQPIPGSNPEHDDDCIHLQMVLIIGVGMGIRIGSK